MFREYDVYDANVHGQNKVLIAAKTFYDMFVEETNRRDISMNRFGKKMSDLGIAKVFSNGVKYVLAVKYISS